MAEGGEKMKEIKRPYKDNIVASAAVVLTLVEEGEMQDQEEKEEKEEKEENPTG